MTGRRRKVSFVLQFTANENGQPNWRGALQEVETGDRRNIASMDALADGLAHHGVQLPRSETGQPAEPDRKQG